MHMQLRRPKAPSVTQAQAAAKYADATQGGSALQVSNRFAALDDDQQQRRQQQQEGQRPKRQMPPQQRVVQRKRQQELRSCQPDQRQDATMPQLQLMEMEGGSVEAVAAPASLQQRQQQQAQGSGGLQQETDVAEPQPMETEGGGDEPEGADSPPHQQQLQQQQHSAAQQGTVLRQQQQQQQQQQEHQARSSSNSSSQETGENAEAWLSQVHQAVTEVLGEDEEAIGKVKWGVVHAEFLKSPLVAGLYEAPCDGVAANGAVFKWAERWLITHGFNIPSY